MCICLSRELAKYDYFEFNLPLYYFFPSPYPFSAETILRFSKGKGVKRFELRRIWPQKKNSPMEAKIKRICRLKKCMPRITDKLMS